MSSSLFETGPGHSPEQATESSEWQWWQALNAEDLVVERVFAHMGMQRQPGQWQCRKSNPWVQGRRAKGRGACHCQCQCQLVKNSVVDGRSLSSAYGVVFLSQQGPRRPKEAGLESRGSMEELVCRGERWRTGRKRPWQRVRRPRQSGYLLVAFLSWAGVEVGSHTE